MISILGMLLNNILFALSVCISGIFTFLFNPIAAGIVIIGVCAFIKSIFKKR
jgi:hypothetical protein